MLGPSFDYFEISELVAHREGSGPLWVAWDTNILSLYESYGLAMWDGDVLEVAAQHDSDEVTALGELITMWIGWDIRFQVVAGTSTDYKRPPTADLSERRERSMRALEAALALGLDGEETFPERRPYGPPSRPLDGLPKGKDRELVQQAYRNGSDVFLTTDKGILRRDTQWKLWGMRCLAPTELIGHLTDAGLPLGFHIDYVLGNAPDLARMSALLGALRED